MPGVTSTPSKTHIQMVWIVIVILINYFSLPYPTHSFTTFGFGNTETEMTVEPKEGHLLRSDRWALEQGASLCCRIAICWCLQVETGLMLEWGVPRRCKHCDGNEVHSKNTDESFRCNRPASHRLWKDVRQFHKQSCFASRTGSNNVFVRWCGYQWSN